MNILYVAWQDPGQRSWFPVGKLVYDITGANYEFAYVKGAEQARLEAGFLQIPGFPDWNRSYRADGIFPMFSNRIMNARRPDRFDYLQQLGIDIRDWNEIAELSVSGGVIQSDHFEIFPEIEPDANGRIETRCILRGLRHTNKDSWKRSESLTIGEELVLSFELNNPATKHALSVKTEDQYVLGWLPHYLVSTLHQDRSWIVEDAKAKVAQVNLESPLSNRILVEFSGVLPRHFNPMRDIAEYQAMAVVGHR